MPVVILINAVAKPLPALTTPCLFWLQFLAGSAEIESLAA